jgi:hypothetical protein
LYDPFLNKAGRNDRFGVKKRWLFDARSELFV